MFSKILKAGISIVELDGVRDLDVEKGIVELPWDSLVDLFRVHEYRSTKDGHCFIPAKFKPISDWVRAESDAESLRNDANVESISMIVLDLDEPGAKEKAEALFSGYEYILYSTFSYCDETPYKYRMVLRLDEPIGLDRWPVVFSAIIQSIEGDQSLGKFSSLYYFPSHNPNAGIAPQFHHSRGIVLAAEHINAIVRSAEQKFGSKLAVGAKKDISIKDVPVHFSGQKSRGQIPVVDYTWEGMQRRFSDAIDHLKNSDQRHQFSLSVTFKDIVTYRNRCDLFQLVQFIYRATGEFSSRSISDPRSNTASELPEMIHSTIRKHVPELLSAATGGYDDVRSHVKNIIKSVKINAAKGAWSFESKIRSENPIEMVRNSIGKSVLMSSDNSFDSIMLRSRLILRDYIASNDVVKFASDVFRSERNVLAEKVNINAIGQFIFYCIDSKLVKILGISGKDKQLQIDSVFTELTKSDSLKMIDSDEEKHRFLETSFKIARNSSETGVWKLEGLNQKAPSVANG